MMKFKVLCYWTESKLVEIEAASKKEARERALDTVEAEEGEYVDDSFCAEVYDEIRDEEEA